MRVIQDALGDGEGSYWKGELNHGIILEHGGGVAYWTGEKNQGGAYQTGIGHGEGSNWVGWQIEVRRLPRK